MRQLANATIRPPLPYLNSSLYEPTELERRVGCYVSNLYLLHPLLLHRIGTTHPGSPALGPGLAAPVA